MRKRGISIVVIALLLIIETTCSAQAGSLYTIEFCNKSDRTVEYSLYRLDHAEIRHPNEIVDVTKGKLIPDESNVISVPAGGYYIAWFEEGEATLIEGTRFVHFANTTFVFKKKGG